MGIENITFSSGFITLKRSDGGATEYPVASILRALDIPVGLTYEQVGTITTLANLLAVLIRTLIDKEVISESFMEDNEYNLDDIIETIEDMGGAYHEPDLSVT